MHANKKWDKPIVLNVLLDNRVGGPQIRVLSVAKELRKYGIETIILAPKGKGDFGRLATREGFKVYQVTLCGPRHFDSVISCFSNLRWFLIFPFSVVIIAKIIRAEHVNIVQANGLLNLQAPVGSWLTRRKIIWYLSSSSFPRVLIWFLMPFVRLVSDQTVITAKRLKAYYFGDQKKFANVPVIYESVDTSEFDPFNLSKIQKNKLRAQFNINPGAKVVGCVGNINPVKGYEYFIQSANLVKKQLNDVKFMIIGAVLDTQTAYYEKLKKLISSLGMEQDVIFTGKRDDIAEMLSLLDVFVLSSVAEGGPRVTVEAMAMMKPVVATDVGAVPEQILNGKTGIIVQPTDTETMSASIIYLLEHVQEATEMGERARERVRELFSLDKCVQQHNRLYHQVLNEHLVSR